MFIWLRSTLPQFASYLSSFQTDPSITYSERIKIETFCELGLSNIQMGVRINFTIYHYDKNNWSFIDKSEPIIGKDCSIIEVK